MNAPRLHYTPPRRVHWLVAALSTIAVIAVATLMLLQAFGALRP